MPAQPAGIAAAYDRDERSRMRKIAAHNRLWTDMRDAVIQALRQHDEDDTTLVLARIPGRPVEALGEA
jgi:hypothetical protein